MCLRWMSAQRYRDRRVIPASSPGRQTERLRLFRRRSALTWRFGPPLPSGRGLVPQGGRESAGADAFGQALREMRCRFLAVGGDEFLEGREQGGLRHAVG